MDIERARLVRRTTILLSAAQVALWGSIGVLAAFAPITAEQLSGRPSASVLLLGAYSIASAASARLIGRYMDRRGRRPGLVVGYLLLAAGGLAGFMAVSVGTTIGLMASAVVLGAGAGAALLGRAAVADMFPAERRGRAVGMLVVVGTLGAVGIPPLAGLLDALVADGGGSPAPWLVVTVLAVGGMALVLALRPDPRALAADPAPAGGRRPAGAILRRRPAVAAVASIGVGQAVMVTFMGVVPVVIHNHGAANLTVTLIVSLHLAGMFAFSSLIGAALDRWGRRSGLLAGVLATAAGILLSLSSATLVAAAGLFLVGVGWSAAYLGSTAVVSDLASPTERAGALGLTDLFAASSAAVGVLGTAVLLEVAGFGTVAVIGLALLVLPAVLLIPLREVAPGSWPPAMAEAGRPGG